MPLIEIHLMQGRTAQEKKNLLASVTNAVQDTLGAPLKSIRVWIQEMSDEDYMVAGVLASDRKKVSS
jgi:4-oxalocrotonate tautomerase